MKFKNKNHFNTERQRKADSFNDKIANSIFISVVIAVIGSLAYYFFTNPLY